MKMIITIILLISSSVFAQNKNFTIENGLVNWRNVYEDSTNILDLKDNPRLQFTTDSTGIIKRTNFNDKKLKNFTAEFKIESKKGKYRVSVYNVIFYVEPVGLNSGGISMQTISQYTIEQSLIKKDKTIRESSFGYNLTETLNPHFVDLFIIKEKEKEDW